MRECDVQNELASIWELTPNRNAREKWSRQVGRVVDSVVVANIVLDDLVLIYTKISIFHYFRNDLEIEDGVIHKTWPLLILLSIHHAR